MTLRTGLPQATQNASPAPTGLPQPVQKCVVLIASNRRELGSRRRASRGLESYWGRPAVARSAWFFLCPRLLISTAAQIRRTGRGNETGSGEDQYGAHERCYKEDNPASDFPAVELPWAGEEQERVATPGDMGLVSSAATAIGAPNPEVAATPQRG